MEKNLTDELLMLRVKQGDPDSLAPLFEKYHVRLFNFFLRMTMDRINSEDLTQNVFKRILMYRESYNETWLFKSWMYQIARNAAAKHYNSLKIVSTDFTESNFYEREKQDAIDEMEKLNRNQLLNEALNKLPYEHREIIELSKFQGLKYQEIAEITGNTVPAIKVKVHRAINKLREFYFELV